MMGSKARVDEANQCVEASVNTLAERTKQALQSEEELRRLLASVAEDMDSLVDGMQEVSGRGFTSRVMNLQSRVDTLLSQLSVIQRRMSNAAASLGLSPAAAASSETTPPGNSAETAG